MNWKTSAWILLLIVLGFSGDSLCAERDCSSHFDEGGPCQEELFRYYFDEYSGRCKLFPYYGCGGNNNRYTTLQTCQSTCMANANLSLSDSETPNDERSCYLESRHGSCEGRYLRWFFNRVNRKCEAFIYGGCGGNLNRYPTQGQCEDYCHRFIYG